MEISFSDVSNADEYLAMDYGSVVSMELIKENLESFADAFCEGSPALKKLLSDLWKQDIETSGCCIGHEAFHIYRKDTIFGGSKDIDEKTYLRHAGDKRYYDFQVLAETHPYLAIKLDSISEPEKLLKKLENDLSSSFSELPLLTYKGLYNIVVCVDAFLPEKERESFFEALASSLEKNMDLIKGPSFKAKTGKMPLDEQIHSAAAKKTEIHTSEISKSRQAEPDR